MKAGGRKRTGSKPLEGEIIHASKASSPDASNLTPKQRLFIQEYLVDLNGTEAAKRAGFSPKSASSYAAQLLADSRISQAISAAQQSRLARVVVTQDEALLALKRLLNFDIRKLYDDQGVMLPAKEWPDDIALAVAGVKTQEKRVGIRRVADKDGGDGDSLVQEFEVTREVKIADRNATVRTALQHLGLLKEAPQTQQQVIVNIKL